MSIMSNQTRDKGRLNFNISKVKLSKLLKVFMTNIINIFTLDVSRIEYFCFDIYILLFLLLI